MQTCSSEALTSDTRRNCLLCADPNLVSSARDRGTQACKYVNHESLLRRTSTCVMYVLMRVFTEPPLDVCNLSSCRDSVPTTSLHETFEHSAILISVLPGVAARRLPKHMPATGTSFAKIRTDAAFASYCSHATRSWLVRQMCYSLSKHSVQHYNAQTLFC